MFERLKQDALQKSEYEKKHLKEKQELEMATLKKLSQDAIDRSQKETDHLKLKHRLTIARNILSIVGALIFVAYWLYRSLVGQ